MKLFQPKRALRRKLREPQSRGVIPPGLARDPRLVTLLEPSSPAAEAYRNLRANLLYSSGYEERHGIVVLSSPEPGEARSLACANLAVAISQLGRSTALVDCDLRNSSQQRIFGTRGGWRVEDLYADDLDFLDDCDEPLPRLKLVAAEDSIPDPTVVLESENFAKLLGRLREDFDHVLVDTPCLERFSDALAIATQSDGVLLALEAGKSRKAAVRQTVHRLKSTGAKMIGTVVVHV